MNINTNSSASTLKQTRVGGIVVGIITMAAVALLGTANMVGATDGSGQENAAPSKQACQQGGWKELGFRNKKDCTSAATQQGNGNGNGYGGGNNNNDFNFDISGDNNVVNIVINYFFG